MVPRPKTVWNNCENCKRVGEKQILCHQIETNPSKDKAMHEGDNPLFWAEFTKFINCSLIVRDCFLKCGKLFEREYNSEKGENVVE